MTTPDQDDPGEPTEVNPYDAPRTIANDPTGEDAYEEGDEDDGEDRESADEGVPLETGLLEASELLVQFARTRRWVVTIALVNATLAAMYGLRTYFTLNQDSQVLPFAYHLIAISSMAVPMAASAVSGLQQYRWSGCLARLEMQPTVESLRTVLRVQHAVWRTVGICMLVQILLAAVIFAWSNYDLYRLRQNAGGSHGDRF